MSTNNQPLDYLEREKALNPNQSYIVQAPAGSGKTELIIQRLLILLSTVKQPQEILAITFTKKAANEVRNRIIEALKFASTQPAPSKPHELKTWQFAKKVLQQDVKFDWNLLDNPNQLQIKTIDAFCAYLTSQLPLLSHFGSQPEISLNPNQYYKEAVLEVISHLDQDLEWSPAISELLSHSDNDLNKLVKLLVQLLQKRDQWLTYLSLDLQEQSSRIFFDNQIKHVVNDNLYKLTEAFPSEIANEILEVGRFAADRSSVRDEFNLIKSLVDTYELPDHSSENLIKWQTIASLLLTKDYKWRKQLNPSVGFPFLKDVDKNEAPLHKEIRKKHKEIVEKLQDNPQLQTMLMEVLLLPQPCYTEPQWSILKALLEVLKVCIAQLRVIFQTHGKIDFIENAQAANHALGSSENPTDLALALDYRINHILVDEFQDTSSVQYNLLKKLTYGWQQNDGRTLFVVGDPMQSIYRFRLAEVGLFIRMQQYGLGDLSLIPITLSVNFRSKKQIVDWNNRHFSAMFPDKSDVGSGAVHYSPSIAQDNTPDDSRNISINGCRNSYEQGAIIATQIKQSLENNPNETIAILVRSRTHLAHIIPYIKEHNIAYNAVAIDQLTAKQCIQDLLALTRALLHPADKIAWLSVLRAPWCGLTLSDLLIISEGSKSKIVIESLFQTEVVNQLPNDSKTRLLRVKEIIAKHIKNRERQSFRSWIESVWQELGGPATLSSVDDIADTNEYFHLLEELSTSNSVTLESLNEAVNDVYASSHNDSARVQIMTVHSAKGLEFDTVILPHLEKNNPADDKNLLSWIDYPLNEDETAMLLAPIQAIGSEQDTLYSYISYLNKIKADFETDRLFYVATTRAKQRLHCYFINKENNQNERKGSFLAKLWPLVKDQIEPLSSTISDVDKNEKEIPDFKNTITRLTSTWQNPISAHSYIDSSEHKNQQGFKLENPLAQIIGTTCHTVLQHIAYHGITWWEDTSTEKANNYIVQLLREAGTTPSMINQAAQQINCMISNTLKSEKGKWILAPHQDHQCEYSLTHRGQDGIERFIIDRTFIENNTRWIIDYKTTELSDVSLETFIVSQKKKHEKQMLKYKLAMQALENRPIKLGLYFPANNVWCEW